jgi:hypothetical protein
VLFMTVLRKKTRFFFIWGISCFSEEENEFILTERKTRPSDEIWYTPVVRSEAEVYLNHMTQQYPLAKGHHASHCCIFCLGICLLSFQWYMCFIYSLIYIYIYIKRHSLRIGFCDV